MAEEEDEELKFDDWFRNTLLKKEQAEELGIPSYDLGIAQKKEFKGRYDIEKWYSYIENETLSSVVIPMTEIETDEIYNGYNFWLTSKDQKSYPKCPSLRAKLESAMDQFPNGFFIKLNSRSPKDVPVKHSNDPQFQNIIKNFAHDELLKNATDQQIYLTLMKGLNYCMKAYTVDDCIKLLTRSHRVYEDMSLQRSLPKALKNPAIVLREWNDELASTPQSEYRCFVFKGNVTCITQYFTDCYLEETIENKDLINQTIRDYLSKIVPLIPIEAFVIDVGYFPDHCLIIELNPFYQSCGSGHFSWKDEAQLLMFGNEFRCNMNEPENALQDAPPEWVKFIKKVVKKRDRGNCAIM